MEGVMEYAGKYIRKNVDFDPSDGWQRKWTYKVGWIGSGKHIHLVAMTDGMITKEMTENELLERMIKDGMVWMSKQEIIEFIQA
jgi:hypothetical protein